MASTAESATQSIAGKADEVLQTPSAVSKVDDSLPTAWKMWKTAPTAKSLDKIDDALLAEARKYKSADEFVEDNILYRWETWWGWNYYSTDFEFARDFTQTGKDSEVIKRWVLKSDIYKKDILPFAWSEDEITKTLSEAKKKWKKAILVSEWKNQPNSVFVFDKTALKTEDQLRKIRDEANKAK